MTANASAVLISHNQDEMLGGLLESLIEADSRPIIYLYLHRPTARVEAVAKQMVRASHRVLVRSYDCNPGVARSWNDGIASAMADGADAVILCNDDIVIAPSDFDELFDKALFNPEVYNVRVFGYDTPERIHRCLRWGFCALNRSAIDKLGYFDENFFPCNCEDVDYSHRADLMGLRPIWIESKAYHHGSATINSSSVYSEAMRGWALNKEYWTRKWGADIDTRPWPFLTPFNNPDFGLYISQEQRHHPYPGFDRPELAESLAADGVTTRRAEFWGVQ